jgi:dipeptidyl aminopeptidase/acylaminoacyl peptidase
VHRRFRHVTGAGLAQLSVGVATVLAVASPRTQDQPGFEESVTVERLLAESPAATARTTVVGWASRFLVVGPQSKSSRNIQTIESESGVVTTLGRGWLPKPSPDGSKVCFFAEDPAGPSVQVKRPDGGMVQRLGPFGRDADPVAAAWSPDSRSLAYWIRDDQALTLWVTSVENGSSIRSLVSVPVGSAVGEVKWSPDAHQVAYSWRPASTTQRLAGGTSSLVVLGAPEARPADWELWIADVASGKNQRLAAGPYLILNVGWHYAGTKLLFTTFGAPEYNNSLFRRVEGREVSVRTGHISTVFRSMGPTTALYSPDGSTIAFTSCPDYDAVDVCNLAIATPGNAGIKELTRDRFIIRGEPLAWSPSGSGVYFKAMRRGLVELLHTDLNGRIQEITAGLDRVHQFTVSVDGRLIAYVGSDLVGRAHIVVVDVESKAQRTLSNLTPRLDVLRVAAPEIVTYRSSDGVTIDSLLLRPRQCQRSNRCPLLVTIHGGPVGGGVGSGSLILGSEPLELQLWAAHGFAVLDANYRSSMLFGREPVLRARRRQTTNDRDMGDIMSGVDHVIRLGWVDPSRLAVAGHSHGAYLTNWIITHTNRFKVAVSYEGYSLDHTFYSWGLEGTGSESFAWQRKGRPWEVPENYRKQNPAEYVRSARTPTLFISGETGPGTNGASYLNNGYLFTALRNMAVESMFLVYKGEGHVMTRPENQRDVLERIAAWLEKYLRPHPLSASARRY